MIRQATLVSMLTLALPALAFAGCRQDKAIYAGSDGYDLAFEPTGTEGGAAAPKFSLKHGDSKLTGFVMESDAPARTVLHVEKDCPEGDLTGDDIAACTAYEGYAYALKADGTAVNLPPSGDEAAPSILLSGLGPALGSSPVAAKLKLVPPATDLFTFKACAP